MSDYEYGRCSACGKGFAGSSGEAVGVQLAVHLYDEHPDGWNEVLEGTRRDLEKVQDILP